MTIVPGDLVVHVPDRYDLPWNVYEGLGLVLSIELDLDENRCAYIMWSLSNKVLLVFVKHLKKP